MSETSDTIARLKSGDEDALKEVYLANKNPFFLFAARYNLSKEDLLDVYQDAIIALYENAKKGKVDDLKSSIATYLFAIGKFMIFKRFKTKKDTLSLDEVDISQIDWEEMEGNGEESQLTLLRSAITKLGEQCQNVLRLFYFEEKKLDEIQFILNYSSKDVLKAQKSRCLKQLKELIQHK
ncbi:MAG: RNA polymerase sigma factor [Bacteroidia bacterium]